MLIRRGCCGQPTRSKARVSPEVLPENPRIDGGVKLLFIGSGKETLRGSAGRVYVVSEFRRRLVVSTADATVFLRRRDLILAP